MSVRTYIFYKIMYIFLYKLYANHKILKEELYVQ